jgi:uncharacterized cupredoxin-like copper-binding protein
VRRAVPAALLCLALAACSNGSGSGSGDAIAITATGTECTVAKTDLTAGKHEFRVRNDGKGVTEVYVYAEGDKVVTEKENIGPGTTAEFDADLTAGSYEVACKPGQQGDGIRTHLHVTGSGGTAQQPADLEAEVEATEYKFEGLDGFAPKAGQTVKFELKNKGTTQHELEVFGPDGKAVGEVGPTDKDDEGEVVLTLAKPGEYRYVCGIADHEARGMKGTFRVS